MNTDSKYDLEERTAKFGEEIIEFCRSIRQTVITKPLISQLIRSATSVGANYCEADDAESRKDFKHKIGICKKEARETQFFLRMVANLDESLQEKANSYRQEARELNLIFNSIFKKLK